MTSRGPEGNAWRRYPYVAPWGDPEWFTFPACDGDACRLGVQTYFVDGFDLRWNGDAGTSSWRHRRNPDGTPEPFAWTLELCGVDHHGARMALELEVEALRPPAPLGGLELGGAMMFLGAERTSSYFQSGLRMRGRLTWGDVQEDVAGEIGWIDRQWADMDVHATPLTDAPAHQFPIEWWSGPLRIEGRLLAVLRAEQCAAAETQP